MIADARRYQEQLDSAEHTSLPFDVELVALLRALVAADPDLRNRRARLVAARQLAIQDLGRERARQAERRRAFWAAVLPERTGKVTDIRRRA